MPLFSFRCPTCGTTFETLAAAAETLACPSCGGTTERLLARLAPSPRQADPAPCASPCAGCECRSAA